MLKGVILSKYVTKKINKIMKL